MTIDQRKAADEAEYAKQWQDTTPQGPSASELIDLCRIHAEKMWNEGWYTTARALYLAADKIEELS